MNDHHFSHKDRAFRRRRRLALFVMVAVLSVSWAAMDRANALYILTGEDDSTIVLNKDARSDALSSKLIYLSSDASGYDVSLTSGQKVTIHHGEETVTAKARRETVSSLLRRMDITPSPLEMVAVDLSDKENAVVTVDDQITYYDKVEEPAAHESRRVPNPAMQQGTEKVVQTGADGVRTSIYEVVWSCGEQISRQFVDTLDSTAVDEIIEYGTAPLNPLSRGEGVAGITKNADGSGTITLVSGAVLPFSQAKDMTATAYTAGYGGADYTTATGTFVGTGTVAVDRKVIPLGSKLFIVTDDGLVYGPAVASDTGVRGRVVDLYFNSYRECINFGRRGCTVYILS